MTDLCPEEKVCRQILPQVARPEEGLVCRAVLYPVHQPLMTQSHRGTGWLCLGALAAHLRPKAAACEGQALFPCVYPSSRITKLCAKFLLLLKYTHRTL